MEYNGKNRKYCLNLALFKKLLKQYFIGRGINKKIYNIILIKIRKNDYCFVFNFLEKYISDYYTLFRKGVENKIYFSLHELRFSSFKYKLKMKRMAKLELLSKPKYIKRLFLCESFDKAFIKEIIEKMDSKQIKIYEKYYEFFNKIFTEVDKQTIKNIYSTIFGHIEIGINIYSLIELRKNWCEYSDLKNSFGIDTWFLDKEIQGDDDDLDVRKEKLEIFLYGYGLYKMGVFKIFKEKWHFV